MKIIKHLVALKIVEYVLCSVRIHCYVMNANDLRHYAKKVNENRELLMMLVVG